MKYAATFGSKYNHEDHPASSRINGYSYVIVEGEDELEAREALADLLGVINGVCPYAFIYPFDDDFMRQIQEYSLHEVKITPVVGAQGTERLDASKTN